MSEATRTTPYDGRFFDSIVAESHESARAVVPTVLAMVRPASVVDFGCGRGAWLKVFRENGVGEVLGLDGPYVDREKLLTAEGDFSAVDLTGPVELGRRLDMAVCLEVAEHLPERASQNLVRSLVAAAPVILFSAAIPGQTGTHHVNEQWPRFWEGLFADAGYARLDAIRPLIWRDTRIAWWYRQNLYLYAENEAHEALRDRGVLASPSFDPHLEIVGRAVLERYHHLPGLLKEAARAASRKLTMVFTRKPFDG